MGKRMRTIWLRPNWAKTKGIELDRKKEKSIHAKNIIIPILINSTHFHKYKEPFLGTRPKGTKGVFLLKTKNAFVPVEHIYSMNTYSIS